MNENKLTQGHLYALFTIFIWSTTFISTKILLNNFSPIEIMFFRLIIAYFVLLLIKPKFLKYKNFKEEFTFMGAGLCGVTLYFIFQNIALKYALASIVGILISVSPFFTALLSHFFLKDEELRANFFIGFLLSIIGIIIVSFNGNYTLKLDPLGDILSILSALVWSIYSILMKKVSKYNYNNIQCTRKIFFYGIIFLIPTLKFFDFRFDLFRFYSMSNLLNTLYLGLGASALCFVTWNYAVSILGTIKTSIYIYIVPIITILVSVIVLHEKITLTSLFGILLILLGLYLSENKKLLFKRHKLEVEKSNIEVEN